jgi:cytochrome c-type biogenesis protein CcmH
MTGFWISAVAMTAVALLFLLPPLLRRRAAPTDVRSRANAAIYREQLEELTAELQRGSLSREEFERASREVERRIIVEHGDTGPLAAQNLSPRRAAIVVALLLPVTVGLGYWKLGNPDAMTGIASEQGHPVTRDQMESLVERLAARMAQTPQDAEGWMLLGRSQAVLGKYDAAAHSYGRAAQLLPEDANLLADYADTLAMAQGRKLAGEPFAIVQRALKADPEHIKSLALAGSAEFERRNFAAAIGYWERIQKIAPPESDFARSVAESIAEARSQAGGTLAKAELPAATKAAPAAKAKPAAAGAQGLQGTVSIDPALAAKLSPTDTVFVLARPVSGSRMPLAVARTTVAALPYRFMLDDSMAMAPGATISSHDKVVVAARVSKSGNAISQKGDVEGSSNPVAPGASNIKVVLSRIVD